MLDPDKQEELEQGQAFLIEALPPLWGGLFKNCMKEGFERDEAFQLVETYIMSQSQ